MVTIPRFIERLALLSKFLDFLSQFLNLVLSFGYLIECLAILALYLLLEFLDRGAVAL